MNTRRSVQLCLALAALCLAAPPAPAQPDPLPPTYGQLQTEPVADGVHVMRQPDRLWALVIGNVTIIEQSDGVVVIDSGNSYGDGRAVAAQVRALTNKPVKAIVVTHWHNDHPSGLGALVEQWPRARVISTAATRDAMRSVLTPIMAASRMPERDTQRLNGLMGLVLAVEEAARDPSLSEEERCEFAIDVRYTRSRLLMPPGTFLVLPTETFTDRLLLDDPVRPIELRFLGRANTEGDAVAWLPRQRILVTGDIVVAPSPYGFGSFPRDWIATLEEVKRFDFTTLIPGHGAPQRDRLYIDKLIDALGEVRRQVAPLAEQGLTVEQVQERVNYDALTDRFAGQSLWARRWFRTYWLIPITASAYREARGLPTVQSMAN